jgi:hypothetical protein
VETSGLVHLYHQGASSFFYKSTNNTAILAGENNAAQAREICRIDPNNELRFDQGANFLRTRIGSANGLQVGLSGSVASAKLQVDSTTQGLLPPRMTTAQRQAIGTPAAGLMVYDTDLGKLCLRTASAWEIVTSVAE